MTLKELSLKLGKPVHVLANILRQVGLADRLLSENDVLNNEQINRLRVPKSISKKTVQSNLDECDKDEYGGNEESDTQTVHTVASLAIELGIAEGRVGNILQWLYGYNKEELKLESDIEDWISKKILSDYKMWRRDDHARSFANTYLRDISRRWDNPVEPESKTNYTPGAIVKGVVYEVDNATGIIKVRFEELSHIDGILWYARRIIDRPARNGILSLSEWDWEICKDEQISPKIGNAHSFLILQNNKGEDLKLSRRQAIDAPEPIDGIATIIFDNPENEIVVVRHSNGCYGFISYTDLYLLPNRLDIGVGESLLVTVKKKFKKDVGRKHFFFAQFDIDNAEYKKERWLYLFRLLGLNELEWHEDHNLTKIKTWNNLVDAYHEELLTEAKITDTNSGGYLMTTLGEKEEEEEYELFCPFSLAPTWIDRSVTGEMIEATWFVKIESDPEGEGNNTIVSAKLEPDAYEGVFINGGFYWAIVCSCNEHGANVLVEKRIPMFVPNKYISWGKDNKAESDLKPGGVVIVKIIKNQKGTIASIRDAQIDPWKRVRQVFPIGQVVEATVIDKEEKGVRLALDEYYGYLPAVKISWTEFISDCREVVLEEDIRVVITGYNDKSKTVQVSLRDLETDPWENLDKYIPEDGKVKAVVESLTLGGAHLKVGDKRFAGYLSYRDVDWCKDVDKDSFPYEIGSSIDIKITHRNKERRKLMCSLKALVENPWMKLLDVETVEGTVDKVYDNYAYVHLDNGIHCVCYEPMSQDMEGQLLSFDVLQLDVDAQKIVISYRKHEIVELNTLAVGEMFKPYRDLSADDKELVAVNGNNEGDEVYRDFKIKEVSSTGRVKVEYAEEDGEYENGILLPNAITVYDTPVNIIFAREIVKRYMKLSDIFTFRVTHVYRDFQYAVLSFDAAEILELDDISSADLDLLRPGRNVSVQVLKGLCTNMYVFVHWKGYFGYIPRNEVLQIGEELPESMLLTVASPAVHPEQMIRFSLPDDQHEPEIKEELEAYKTIAEKLEQDLYDCYITVTNLPGFKSETPDLYPYDLQLRYDPEKFPELSSFLASGSTEISGGSLHLTSVKVNKDWRLNIFNSTIGIEAFCSPGDECDEIRITSCNLDIEENPQRIRTFGRPLKIEGENIKIVPINSSAMPPSVQDADIIMELLKYNREVIPALKALSRGYLEERGEHYLTLKELLTMDLNREKMLGDTEVTITSTVFTETSGSLGSYGIKFTGDATAFASISSADDSQDGIRVLLKPNDGEKFPADKKYDSAIAKGLLKYAGSCKWVVELYRDSYLAIDELNKCGLLVKRNPNTLHLQKQIFAIDNFVYERNGLDIFGKIARNKLNIPVYPNVDDIIANDFINLSDESDSQANAIKMALGGSQIALIQGPPGTGKSTVIVDIIKNLVRQGKKILVCTQSVAPIEELYYKLSGRRDRKLIGTPASIDGRTLRCAYLRDNDSLELSGSVEERKESLKDVVRLLNTLKRTNDSAASKGSNIDIEALKKDTESVLIHNKEIGNRILRKFSSEVQPYFDEVHKTLSEYIDALDKKDVEMFQGNQRTLQKDAVDVVFGTCIGVGVNPFLKDIRFDTLIIDEAGKANYAESLVPMMMANEYILVGDDRQLPPYTNSELVRQLAEKHMEDDNLPYDETLSDAEFERRYIKPIMEDVGKSLFGDLKPLLPKTNNTMLSKQFRMHPMIGNFVSKLFYEGKVSSMVRPETRVTNIEGLESPIIFYDTTQMGWDAHEAKAGMSLYNDGEIQVIEDQLVDKLISAKQVGKTVGILSPYGAQVMRMKERFKKYDLHRDIFTIDSIQGEEYDIVVFSFVRNTSRGNLNFIDNLNRLNVSFSRAKCNLVMVGHLNTLLNDELHKDDQDAVMSVYKEIQNKKVKQITLPGAMQLLFEDFPPEDYPLLENLDAPYTIFEKSRPTGKGSFSIKYRGKLLSLYNPALKGVSKATLPDSFRSYLLGYKDKTPYTMIEPMALWLSNGCELKRFAFKAKVVTTENKNIVLRLFDGSEISLSVPHATSFDPGTVVRVSVRSTYKNGDFARIFTIKSLDNE